jgi:4-amino-4-deoxy-L-arabinose transferase-like glycosyltransferase
VTIDNLRGSVLLSAAIALIVLVLTLHHLGSGPCDGTVGITTNAPARWFCGTDVWSGNEAVEAVFLQGMVEQGDLLFPLENGRQPMYKPPLFHWTAWAIDRAAGLARVTAFNLRLPSALYAAAGAALATAFACWMFGLGAGLLTGLALAGSYQYISNGRLGRVDMALAFFETVALLIFLWWYGGREGRPRVRDLALRYAFGAALGLAVLAKGPVGALLPALAIGIFLLSAGELKMIARFIPGPVLVALGLGGSWYAACFFGGRYGFLQRQLGSENFGRFFGALGVMKPWYYVGPILLNSLPLSLLVPIAVAAAMHFQPAVEGLSAEQARARHAALRVLGLFWIVTVIFFSLAAYKRRAYLLPLWPAAAILLGWWGAALSRWYWGKVFRAALVAICLGLAAFNYVYIPRLERRACDDQSYRPAATAINRVVGRNEPLYVHGFHEELAPLLFYLDRNVTVLRGRLGDSPPGYVIVPGAVWDAARHRAPGLTMVLRAPYGRDGIVLLSHGRFYAAR